MTDTEYLEEIRRLRKVIASAHAGIYAANQLVASCEKAIHLILTDPEQWKAEYLEEKTGGKE